MQNEKTNVMRLLEQKKVAYVSHVCEHAEGLSGTQVAEALGEAPEKAFKTLVTCGSPRQYYVFVIPVSEELDLKKAAKACGEKSIAMLPQKDLLPLTGYVHGGCSPIGMKKKLMTYVDESAERLDTMCFSGGKIGVQVEIRPQDLPEMISFSYAELCVK